MRTIDHLMEIKEQLARVETKIEAIDQKLIIDVADLNDLNKEVKDNSMFISKIKGGASLLALLSIVSGIIWTVSRFVF